MSDVVTGVCKWFSPGLGYGFACVDGDDTKEYFIHYSVIQIEGFKTLDAGQKIKFKLKPTDKGIQAIDVELI